MALALSWIVWWFLCAALWLALVDTVDEAQLLTGAVAATIGATAAAIVHAQRLTIIRPRLRWALRVWRPLLSVFTDTWTVTAALLRRIVLREPVTGRFRAIPFAGGEEADPRDNARRALTEGFASLAPNRYVIGVDRERDVLLVHELVPSDDPIDVLDLG